MRVGIVGAGLIGNKRASNLGGAKLAWVADVVAERAKKLADRHDCSFTSDWREVVEDDSVDLVIVSTTNDSLAQVAIGAIKNGKHTLIEKPCARNPKELLGVINAARRRKGVKVKAGFNHRFHPALAKAKDIFDSGDAGELMYIRARYGHGGRKGYDREWRAKLEKAGGGEMLDQGIHVVDLSRWFAGDFDRAFGLCGTMFWDMEVEDNGFALLKNRKGQIAMLQTSWTEWKNLFSFEIFCRRGKLEINGLGGSYGEETLTYYKMKPELGIPDKFVYGWPGEDISWKLEFENFLDAIKNDREPLGTIKDAYAAMKIIFDIYKWNKAHGK
ncbi:MAG: Gfo/Idh/MocA family oxidoreductase [Candidatus Hadarchaeota archaeon]